MYGEPWTEEALDEVNRFLNKKMDKSSAQATQKRTKASTFERTSMDCPIRAGMTEDGLAARVWKECCTAAWLHRSYIERLHPGTSIESDEEEHDDRPEAMFYDDNEEPLEPLTPLTMVRTRTHSYLTEECPRPGTETLIQPYPDHNAYDRYVISDSSADDKASGDNSSSEDSDDSTRSKGSSDSSTTDGSSSRRRSQRDRKRRRV